MHLIDPMASQIDQKEGQKDEKRSEYRLDDVHCALQTEFIRAQDAPYSTTGPKDCTELN